MDKVEQLWEQTLQYTWHGTWTEVDQMLFLFLHKIFS